MFLNGPAYSECNTLGKHFSKERGVFPRECILRDMRRRIYFETPAVWLWIVATSGAFTCEVHAIKASISADFTSTWRGQVQVLAIVIQVYILRKVLAVWAWVLQDVRTRNR